MAVVFSERTQPVDLDAVKAVDAVQRYRAESGRPLVSAQEHEQLCELFDEVLVPALIEPTPEASVSEHAMAELARALQLGAECAQHELASLLESAQISLQQQLSSEQSAKASALEDAQRVRSERDAANTRAESLSKERDQHRDESRRKDAELQRWRELARGRTESSTSGQSDDDDNDVASLKRAVQQARDEMDGYQRIYAEQQHYVDGLEAQVHRLQAQLDGEPDGYGGLAQENEERDLKSKGSELSSHRERVHSLESQRAQSMFDAQEKQAEIDRLQQQLQERKEPESEPGVQEETVKGRLAHLEVENAAEEEQQLRESNVKDVRSDSELQHVHKQHRQLSETVQQTQLESRVLCSHAGYGPDEEVDGGAYEDRSMPELEYDKAENRRLQDDRYNLRWQLLGNQSKSDSAPSARRSDDGAKSDAAVSELKKQLQVYEAEVISLHGELQRERSRGEKLREDIANKLQSCTDTNEAWKEVAEPLIETLRFPHEWATSHAQQAATAGDAKGPGDWQKQSSVPDDASRIQSPSFAAQSAPATEQAQARSSRAHAALEERLEEQSKEMGNMKQILQRAESRVSGRAVPSSLQASVDNGREEEGHRREGSTQERLQIALQELEHKDVELRELGKELQQMRQHCDQSAEQRKLLYDEFARLRDGWQVEKQHLRSKIDDEQAEKEAARSEVEALRSDTSLSGAAQSSAELRMRAEKAERALNKALSREASERKQKLDTEDRLSELSRVYSQRLLTLDNAAERAETCAQKLENEREQVHAVPWETCRSVCDVQLQLKEAHQRLLSEGSEEAMADADVQQARKRQEAAEIRAVDAEDGAEIDRLSDTLLYQSNVRRRSELHDTRNNSHTRQQQCRADQHHDEHGCREMNQEAEHRRREDRDDKQAEVDRLKDELESTRAQVLGQPHRGTEVAKRKLQMQQKDKKIAQLREAVKELEKKYAEALKEKSDADMRESAAESARHLQKQVASLQGKLRSANASLEQSKERERSLEHQRQRFERHAASLPSNEQLRALQQRQHDLQQQNHSLAHQLHQVKEQMQDARASGGGARDKAHQQQQQQQEQTWQPQIASYSKENAKLRKRVESLKSKLSSSEQEHQAAKQHVNKLQERIDRLEREKQPSSARQQAQQQQQRKQQSSSGPASSARALHEENERLNAELAERQKREGEGDKVKRLEEELQKLREKRIEMSANEATQEVQELHDANFDKESMILQLRFECEQQRAKAERLENRIEELFRSKEGGSDSSSRRPPWNPGREQELEEVVHGLRRVVERLRGENASLRHRANLQKSEQQSRLLQEARERASELEDERDSLKQRVAEVEDENRRLVQEVSSGLEKASSEDNETRKRELEAQVQQEQEEAERKRHEVQCLGDELEQLRIEHAKTLEELREMQQQHGREGGEKNGLEDKAVEAVAEEPEGGESEVSKREELEQENADLRAELDALSPSFFQEVAELKRSHEQQAEMLSRYEAQLQEFAAEQGREFTPLRRPGAESKSEGR